MEIDHDDEQANLAEFFDQFFDFRDKLLVIIFGELAGDSHFAELAGFLFGDCDWHIQILCRSTSITIEHGRASVQWGARIRHQNETWMRLMMTFSSSAVTWPGAVLPPLKSLWS